MLRLVSPLALSLARVRSDTQHPTVQTVTSLRPKKHLGSKSPKPQTAVMKQLETRPSNRSSSSSSKTRGNSPENDRETSNQKHLNLSKSSSSSSASLSSIAASGWLACEKSEMAMCSAPMYFRRLQAKYFEAGGRAYIRSPIQNTF